MFGCLAMPKRKQKSEESGKAGDRLNIRIDLAGGLRIGPGKVAVLEEIARSGSISAAGRAFKMCLLHSTHFRAFAYERNGGGSGRKIVLIMKCAHDG